MPRERSALPRGRACGHDAPRTNALVEPIEAGGAFFLCAWTTRHTEAIDAGCAFSTCPQALRPLGTWPSALAEAEPIQTSRPHTNGRARRLAEALLRGGSECVGEHRDQTIGRSSSSLVEMNDGALVALLRRNATKVQERGSFVSREFRYVTGIAVSSRSAHKHFFCLRPLPHGHESLRPVFGAARA
jgi:hypothetical protein